MLEISIIFVVVYLFYRKQEPSFMKIVVIAAITVLIYIVFFSIVALYDYLLSEFEIWRVFRFLHSRE